MLQLLYGGSVPCQCQKEGAILWSFHNYIEGNRIQEITCISKVLWIVALWSWQRDAINLFVQYPSFQYFKEWNAVVIYMSILFHTTLSFSTSPCSLLNFPFHFPNNLTNTSVPENPLTVSYRHIDARNSSHQRWSPRIERELTNSTTMGNWCSTNSCCKTQRSHFFADSIGHLPLQVSKSAEPWPARKRRAWKSLTRNSITSIHTIPMSI